MIYIFGRKPLDVKLCVEKVSSYLLSKEDRGDIAPTVQLRHDVAYNHVAGTSGFLNAWHVNLQVNFFQDELADLLRLELGDKYRVLYNSLPKHTLPRSTGGNEDVLGSESMRGNSLAPVINTTIWVGEESTTLTKLLMTSSGNEVRL